MYEEGLLKFGSRKKVSGEADVWFEKDLLKLCTNFQPKLNSLKNKSSSDIGVNEQTKRKKGKKCELF